MHQSAVKTYYIYIIVDEETGEILTNINNKDYVTTRTEKESTYDTYTQGGRVIPFRRTTTTRIVKHRGQLKIDFD